MPWTEGRLDLEAALAHQGTSEGIWQIAMVATLLLTAVVVLWVVARKLLPDKQREG